MSDSSDIRLAARLHPRASLMSDESAEVGVLLDVFVPGAKGEPKPVKLVLISLGEPPVHQKGALAGGLERFLAEAPPEQVQLVGTPGSFGKLSRLVHTGQDFASALSIAHAQAIRLGQGTRIIFAINVDRVGDLALLDQVATLLGEANLPVDLICTDESADLGLITAVAGITGGELIHVGRTGYADAFLRRIEALRRQPVSNLRLELSHAAHVQPRLVFRLSPRPALLTVVDHEEHCAPLMVPVVPMEADAGLCRYFVSVTVPRPRTGDYRVFGARLLGDDDTLLGEIDLLHRSTLDPEDALVVEAEVVAAQEKAEAIAWVEEMAQAANQGDVRRVANLLERVVLRAAAFGRDDLADVYADIRRRFLRSGVFGRLDANTLRSTVRSL